LNSDYNRFAAIGKDIMLTSIKLYPLWRTVYSN